VFATLFIYVSFDIIIATRLSVLKVAIEINQMISFVSTQD